MQKIRYLFAACTAAAVLAVLAFVNNLAAIVNWWRAFVAAGGDTGGIDAHAPGFIPWLDWSAVDYSAVTTLIPAIGLVCMSRSLFLMLRGRRMRTGDFPFFRGSDQLNVALGLFGTLWGIIVIGYFRLDTVSMADLMQCLHTALFSTLAAVVWVFMIDRPLVRPYFTRLLMRANLAETDNGDLAAAVERLVMRLGEASDAFDRRQQEFERTFESRQARFESAFKERLSSFAEALGRQQREFETAFNLRQESAVESFSRRQAEIDEALRNHIAEIDSACKERIARYEKEFEARQKEYVETFRRRIEELQASASEARSRADEANARATAADAKLKAVTVALQG